MGRLVRVNASRGMHWWACVLVLVSFEGVHALHLLYHHVGEGHAESGVGSGGEGERVAGLEGAIHHHACPVCQFLASAGTCETLGESPAIEPGASPERGWWWYGGIESEAALEGGGPRAPPCCAWV